MPIDPAYLSVQPVQIQSPMQSIGALMQMRNLSSEIAYRQAEAQRAQQQTADIQAQAVQRNRDLADQNTLQQALQDPTKAPKIMSGDLSDIQGNLQPKTVQAFMTWHNKDQQEKLANTKEQNTIISENLGKIEDAAVGLRQLAETDPGTAAQAYPGALANLRAQKAFQYLPDAQIPSAISGDPKELDQMLASIGGLKAAHDKALATQGEQQKVKLSQAQAREAGAKAEQTEYETSLMKQGGGTVQTPEAQVAARIDPQKYPDFYKEALAAGNAAAQGADVRVPGARQKAFAEAVDKVYEKLAPYLPDTLAGEQQKQAALLPGELKKEISARVGVAQAMNPATPETSGVPLIMRKEVQDKYAKSITDLNSSAADANRLHALIASAQGGNKAAPGLVPIAELRGYLNRINTQELRSVSGQAGSWLDRAEGFIKGATEGQPVPPDILRAVDGIAGLQMQNAETKHTGEVNAINTAYHSQFKPQKIEDLGFSKPAATAPVQRKKGDRVMYQGREHTITDIVNGKLILSP